MDGYNKRDIWPSPGALVMKKSCRRLRALPTRWRRKPAGRHMELNYVLRVKKNFFKIGEYLAKLQARTWLSHARSSSFSSVLARRAKCMRQSRSCL